MNLASRKARKEDQMPIHHSVTVCRSLHRVLKEGFTGKVKSLNAEFRKGRRIPSPKLLLILGVRDKSLLLSRTQG